MEATAAESNGTVAPFERVVIVELTRLLAVARGDEPADFLLADARVIDVFGGEVVRTDVAVAGPRIAAVGPGYAAREVVDLQGRYLLPGLIDAHTHIESAMLPPEEFAAVVVPRGVTAVIADPHEIANVLGLDGIRYLLRAGRAAPLRLFLMAPSCVPASDLATAGARLSAAQLAELLVEPEVLGLAEVMDDARLVAGDPELLAKLQAFAGRPIDGHAPGLSGPALNAYAAAGIRSDHECTGVDEARRKLAVGMAVFIREGSVARDLTTLLPLVNAANERCFCLCTDDRQVTDLLDEGSIDHLIRQAVREGLEPLAAIRLATLNPAERFGLRELGAIAPGRLADFVVSPSLERLAAEQVWIDGRPVARDGRLLQPLASRVERPTGTVRVDWQKVEFALPAAGPRVRAIGIIADRLITETRALDTAVDGAFACSDPARDLLKLAVIERHHGSGNVGLAFVQGIGLGRGALASTVAHDHHNLIVVGADDRSMLTAARAAAAVGGGLAVAEGERLVARLPLPVAGLLSDRPHGELARELRDCLAAARNLGAQPRDPFMTLSFLGLEVIPSLKLTDRGLVDVEHRQFVSPFVT